MWKPILIFFPRLIWSSKYGQGGRSAEHGMWMCAGCAHQAVSRLMYMLPPRHPKTVHLQHSVGVPRRCLRQGAPDAQLFVDYGKHLSG